MSANKLIAKAMEYAALSHRGGTRKGGDVPYIVHPFEVAMILKENSFEDSFMNVTGVLITAGNLYTYVDYAAGYNHSWLGGNFVNDFAAGNSNAKWEARFNINFGYYF